jgi:ElaB/YqjD/DUF883 family membrane-anchored ribosome-binding protein
MKDNKQYLDTLSDELNQYKDQLASIKDSFKDKTGKDASKIYDSLNNILQEAGKAYTKLEAASASEWEPLKKLTKQAFGDLKKSFAEYGNSALEQTNEYTHLIEEFSQEKLDLSAEYIKQNPFKSILLATGLGFIIGRVLK